MDSHLASFKAPYERLFIYYLQGCLRPDISITKDDFIGNWEEDDFSFLFFTAPADKTVYEITESQSDLVLLDKYEMTYEEWQGGKITSRALGNFFILPPWEDIKSPHRMHKIILDPGVVFGTGTHPTTGDCLRFIEKICTHNRINTAIDAGTGTGILALAAACLGVKYTLALDFNFLAALTAKKNVEINRMENKILVFQGRAEEFMNIEADLFIANIHYDVMKDLIRSKGFLEKKWFVLSGLLRSQAGEIFDVLSKYPVEIIDRLEHGGIWHTFLGKICNY